MWLENVTEEQSLKLFEINLQQNRFLPIPLEILFAGVDVEVRGLFPRNNRTTPNKQIKHF